MTIRFSDVKGRLNYLLIYARNLPLEDKTTLDGEFNKLKDEVDHLGKRASGVNDERSFAMAMDEIQQSWSAFKAGDELRGCQLLQTAERHLTDGVRHKKTKITFVAGANGVVEKKD